VSSRTVAHLKKLSIHDNLKYFENVELLQGGKTGEFDNLGRRRNYLK
jgi:hypothetical protein